MDKLFFPVRILDREWAERFADGEIFMRSLSEFGVWKRLKVKDDETLANSFRGDIGEGAIKNVLNAEDDEFFRLFPDELKKVIKKGKIIDNGDAQYFNILCLYCLRYDYVNRRFESPSEKIKQFGDTAVVLEDTTTFLDRLLERVERREKYAFLLNLIEYYSEDTMKPLNPFFNKSESYIWQNELRIAIGRLNEEKVLKNGKYPLIESTEPLKLYIGSLRNIVQLVPIDDFIHGTWDMSKVQFANSIRGDSPIDKAMKITSKIVSEYNPKGDGFIFDV